MDEQVTGLLLDGITAKEFTVFYLVGIAGIAMRFLWNLYQGINLNPETPYKFQFRYFLKGFLRIILSLGFMAVVVARFPEMSDKLIDIDVAFNIPTRLPSGTEVGATAHMTAGLAFIIGLGIDEVVKRFVHSGSVEIKKRKK